MITRREIADFAIDVRILSKSNWRSSLKRNDAGASACEVIPIESISLR